MGDCSHPNLRFYNDGKAIHCVTCMSAWVAYPYYPTDYIPNRIREYVEERPFPSITNGKIYLPRKGE